MGEKDFRYSVLFTRTERQPEICGILSGEFPEGRGKVFLPLLEYYRRDRKETGTKPLFPGYIFVYSDMEKRELHAFLRAQQKRFPAFIRELGLPEGGFGEEPGAAEAVPDLTVEESRFLDLMLDEKGVQRMSAGYRETNGKTVVMEGPLAAFSERIVRTDRHERLAYLDLMFREFEVVAGLEIKPKKHYFPDDEGVPAVLSDGTEVDIAGLKKRMMQG